MTLPPLLETLFRACETAGASDIHLSANQPPWFRIQGRLAPASSNDPTANSSLVTRHSSLLSEADIHLLATTLASLTLPPGTPPDAIAARLATPHAIDGACSSASGTRYRFNVFRDSAHPAIAFRRLDDAFRPLADLGLPPRLATLCDAPDGLVIVTGPTGSGKSTTLATLIDQINRTRPGHIVTIEDPIEYLHRPRACLVRQRQIGRDAATFHAALVEALRQDPDVILVGEIREIETIRTAITAAETGHLVFTTLHAGDCAGAIERLVAVFPSDEQDAIRRQLSMVLRGILAQHLLPCTTGPARVPACELLLSTPAVANIIATGRTNQLPSVLETNSAQGMFSLDQSLATLVATGKVPLSAALALSRNPDALSKRLAAIPREVPHA